MIAAFHITVAMKPLDGNFAQNALEHGVAGLNIDRCRAAGTPESTRFDPKKHAHEGWRMTSTGSECAANASPSGRWPANLIHDGSDEVLACFPVTTSGKPCGKRNATTGFFSGITPGATDLTGFGDTGSAARFFKQIDEYKK
jgi:site-specific DNA-methyltransferase (adenine-specific)